MKNLLVSSIVIFSFLFYCLPASGAANPPAPEPAAPLMGPVPASPVGQQITQQRSIFVIRKFDPDKLVITEWPKNKWAVVDPKDNRLFIAITPSKLDAEMAVRTIKFYGVNEAVIFANADIQLLLSSGKAPAKPHPGEYQCDRFDPNALDSKCNDRRCWLEYMGNTISIFGPNMNNVLETIKKFTIEKEIMRRCTAKPPERGYGSGGCFRYWRSESEQEKANPLDEQCISFNPFKMEWVRESYMEKGKEKDKAYFCTGTSSPVPECLNFMKEYKLNQICRARIQYVSGSATINYFLVSGKAPRGKFNYGKCFPFDPEMLVVKPSPDLKHSIVSGEQIVFQSRLFYKISELDRLVKIIQKYEFNTRCDVPTDLGRANGWQVR